MRPFIPYDTTTIKFEVLPRVRQQLLRHALCSVANLQQRIPFILNCTNVKTRFQADVLANREYFDLLKGKTVAICSLYNAGDMVALANKYEIDFDVLALVPRSSLRSENDRTVAGLFSAIVGAADGKCKIRWFGGRVAFLEPNTMVARVRLEGLKAHSATDIADLNDWPRESLATLVAATRKLLVLSRKDVNELRFIEEFNTLIVVAEAASCGPIHTLLKGIGAESPPVLD